jgi:phage tail sheath protein FI
MYTATPGVYVQEIATLPPSVAEVSTAIPVFIGYVQTPGADVTRITSMLEYRALFGTAVPSNFKVKVNPAGADGTPGTIDVTEDAPAAGTHQTLFYSLSHYFINGGGPCYVIPIGGGANAKADFQAGLDKAAELDEPTLILFPEATALPIEDYGALAGAALAQCNDLKDRFTILDVPDGKVDDFRTRIGMNYLSYGAAYHPYLETTINPLYDETAVTVDTGDAPAVAPATGPGPAPAAPELPKLSTLQQTKTDVYNRVKDALSRLRITLPPSPAMAGIYASVDRDRGVWKAPANASVEGVIGAVTRITDAAQAGLNIDPTAGKSINAIRDFTGKGTLVWGSRTLAGNDNEWRYVPVRRLFIAVEENTKKASAFAVFEPNDATTWLKVKGMIESYLYNLWRDGALAGAKPDDAFFVHVGLGKTMTAQDVLEGKLIVEIGLAAVRPAEFVMLRFMHLLQKS